MNDVLNTFCTPNAPWRLTTIEHGQPGEGWPFNQFYKHVVLYQEDISAFKALLFVLDDLVQP